MAKFVFVTGGVLSSLGKGITAASLGALLKSRGYRVALRKFDPYLNYGPGTMSPLQHGEIYVTSDGMEGDLDLGHYERFTSTETNMYSDITSGKIYYNVLEKERKGEYLGATVQVIPHITDEIKNCITIGTEDYDIVIVEIGGTIGDIEGLPFLDAIRQLQIDSEEGDILCIHVTLVPYIKSAGELKTKPTQHSVRQLQEIGISPDILVCRSEYPISDSVKEKLALFCNVDKDAVINCMDAATIYQVPLTLNEQGLDRVVLNKLNLEDKSYDLSPWQEFVKRIKQPKGEISIAVVGKYLETKDAYISLTESLLHGAVANYLKVNIKWIDAENLEIRNPSEYLDNVDGILISAGFGERGMEGKINAVNFARTKDIPFLGISMGLHAAVIEFSRNVLKLSDAKSAEMSQPEVSNNLVIDYQHDENYNSEMGASMRLGSYTTVLEDNTLVKEIYGTDEISERHRHRLEINNKYIQNLSNAGMKVSGYSKDSGLADIIEIPSHTWFVATEFCPEFQSRPFEPHPLFTAFVKSAKKFHDSKN